MRCGQVNFLPIVIEGVSIRLPLCHSLTLPNFQDINYIIFTKVG